MANAGMMKLVNMLDLGSSAAMLVGSSPTTRTSSEIPNTAPFPPDGENCALLGISSPPNRTRFAGLRFGGPPCGRLFFISDRNIVFHRSLQKKGTTFVVSFIFSLARLDVRAIMKMINIYGPSTAPQLQQAQPIQGALVYDRAFYTAPGTASQPTP